VLCNDRQCTAVLNKLWDTVWFGKSKILEKPVVSNFRVVIPCSLVGRYQKNMLEEITASITRACHVPKTEATGTSKMLVPISTGNSNPDDCNMTGTNSYHIGATARLREW
jgi:hypothetical protein